MAATERELEKQLKALANRRRLAILKYLKSKREASVGDIAEEINLSFKSTSKHLAVRDCGKIFACPGPSHEEGFKSRGRSGAGCS